MKILLSILLSAFSLVVFSQGLNADFTVSKTSACMGDALQFTNQSTGSNITTYNWNFGNGETSSAQNPVYTYPAPGTYTVTFTIQSSGGGADAEVKTDYITVHENPVASFTFQGNQCTVPATINFTPGGTGMTYAWNLGNGTTSTSANPSATYTSEGSYTVTLTATDAATHCSGSIQKVVKISQVTAEFTNPASACAGNGVAFQNQSSSNADTWSWTAQGAGSSSTKNPSFTFPAAGTYSVTLTATNAASGCSATATHTIQINEGAIPSFTANPKTGCSPTNVTFTNTTTGTGNDYVWDLGDGTTYTGQTPPTHTYSENGSYDIKLTYTDPTSGCVATFTSDDYIVISDVQASFTFTPMNGCEPLNVNFVNTSTTPNSSSSPIISWKWSFGNGQTSTVKNPPSQTYNEGVYDVSLIIQTANGCKDTMNVSEAIKVGTKLNPDFMIVPTVTCANSNVDYYNTTVINPSTDMTGVTWDWDFGDGSHSNVKDPHHEYVSDTGYVDVQLIVDYRGCKDTVKVENAVYVKAPISKFSLAQTTVCNPTSFPVSAQTVDNSFLGKTTDDIDVYWKWGDGTQTHIPNSDLHDSDKSSSSHDFSTYGSYSIWQIAQNHTTGCVDSSMKTFNISKIDGGFSLPDSVCKLVNFSINGNAATSTHTLTNWSYTMGNGQTATGNPATYAYATAGNFTVKQTVTNNVGCTATLTKTITALELPKAEFTLSPTSGCSPLVTTATNQSSPQGNGVTTLTSFLWTNMDTQDQTTTTNLSSSPSFTFTGAGLHEVGLVVTDAFGCKSSMTKHSVEIILPVAAFSMDSIVCNKTDFTITNASTGANPLTYQWLIDNNANTTDKNLTYQYNDTPTTSSDGVPHTVTLIVRDGNGCINSLTKNMMVSTPHANYSFQASGASIGQDGSFTCPPVFVDYTDESTSVGDIVAWDWFFFSGTNASTKQDPSNTFVFPGTYSTSLVVTDEYGCKDSILIKDILVIGGPEAHPTVEKLVGQCGEEMVFDMGENHNISSYTWAFGDGNDSSNVNPTNYFYGQPGTYIPTLTVSDDKGCEVIYPLDTIVIATKVLSAYFTVSPDKHEVGSYATFSDDSQFGNSPIVSWDWTVNDSTFHFTNGNNWSMVLTHPGTYNVTLSVTNALGCVATYSTTFYVDPTVVISNVFTPNGDGVNDEAVLLYDYFKEYEIVIVNRWGNLIFEGSKMTGIAVWNGKTMKGNMCNDGVYFYIFKGKLLDDGTETEITANGFIHLLGGK